jgi:hypothetical protein
VWDREVDGKVSSTRCVDRVIVVRMRRGRAKGNVSYWRFTLLQTLWKY